MIIKRSDIIYHRSVPCWKLANLFLVNNTWLYTCMPNHIKDFFKPSFSLTIGPETKTYGHMFIYNMLSITYWLKKSWKIFFGECFAENELRVQKNSINSDFGNVSLVFFICSFFSDENKVFHWHSKFNLWILMFQFSRSFF